MDTCIAHHVFTKYCENCDDLNKILKVTTFILRWFAFAVIVVGDYVLRTVSLIHGLNYFWNK